MMKGNRTFLVTLGIPGLVLLLGAACGDSSGLAAGRDAAPAGSGGALGQGGSDSEGGATGSGGRAATGGATGRGGSPGSGGATGGATSSAGATAGMIGSGGASGGMTGTAGSSSTGGRTGLGGAYAAGGTAGTSSIGRDAGTSYDVTSDSVSPDRPNQDAATETGGSDALSAAAQEYAKQFAEPYCKRLAECCAQQSFPTPGLAACVANELRYVKHLDDGSEVIDPTAIQTILSQLQNSCDQPSYALLATTTKGTRLSGEPCEDGSQCAGDPTLCRLSSETDTSGKCMTPPRGKVGDGCSSTCDDTSACQFATSAGKSPYSACYEQDGLRCDDTTYTCVALSSPGGKCTDYSDCGAHADCRDGTCVARVKLGEDCSNGKSCDSGMQCGSAGSTDYTCKKFSIAWDGSCNP